MKWVSAFHGLAINYGEVLAQVENQTQRLIFSHNLRGNRIRVWFSNRYAVSSLHLARVTVGIVKEGKMECVTIVTRNQKEEIFLAPDEECYSDIVELHVTPGNRVAVLCYIKEKQAVGSVCAVWSRDIVEIANSAEGDYTDGSGFVKRDQQEIYRLVRDEPEASRGMFFYGLSGVQVWTEEGVNTIAAFGDSITHMSYVTDALQRRLFKAYPGRTALRNLGIGGNRLLRDATWGKDLPGNGRFFGLAGIRRFEADIFAGEVVDTVLVMEGINDIMHPLQFGVLQENVDAEEIAGGYCYLVDIAHRHGVQIFGATLPPCGNRNHPAAWKETFDRIREEVNAIIRADTIFDGYFDYDRAVRDPKEPSYMKREYHIGDGLHPNAAGGAAMAACVDVARLIGQTGKHLL